MSYRAPVADMLFVMKELAGLEAVSKLPGFEEAGLDTAQAVLEECARFNEQVIAPLDRAGDTDPSSWKGGDVTTPVMPGMPGYRPPSGTTSGTGVQTELPATYADPNKTPLTAKVPVDGDGVKLELKSK